jgi:hypothetical protein
LARWDKLALQNWAMRRYKEVSLVSMFIMIMICSTFGVFTSMAEDVRLMSFDALNFLLSGKIEPDSCHTMSKFNRRK